MTNHAPTDDGLLPCPFCGGEAECFDDHDTGSFNFGMSCITCKRCGASSAMHGDRKENLVSSWNERPGVLPSEVLSEEPKRITGCVSLVEEAACLIWDEFFPGMVMGDADLPHYEAAAKRVLALATRPATSEREVAWLVEWPQSDQMPPRWWHCADGWMLDANKATRFARKVDAEGFIRAQRLMDDKIATEHIWLSADPAKHNLPFHQETMDGLNSLTIRRESASAAEGSGEPLEASPRLGGIGVDWWAESVKLYRQNKKLSKALKEQHDWHLSQGEQDFGDGITLNMADEYADSSMCERTTAALGSVTAYSFPSAQSGDAT